MCDISIVYMYRLRVRISCNPAMEAFPVPDSCNFPPLSRKCEELGGDTELRSWAPDFCYLLHSLITQDCWWMSKNGLFNVSNSRILKHCYHLFNWLERVLFHIQWVLSGVFTSSNVPGMELFLCQSLHKQHNLLRSSEVSKRTVKAFIST